MSKLLTLFLGIGFMLGLSGCAGSILPSHIHDAERASLTAKLVDTLDAYDQNAPSIYETMLKSSRAIAAEQDKVLAELTNNRAAARDQQLPVKTYAALNGDVQNVRERLKKVENSVWDNAKGYLKEQQIVADDVMTAAQAIHKANKAVADAKADVTNWNASIALLQAGVSQLPAIAAAKTDDSKQKGLDSLNSRLRDIGVKEVEFVDADGATQKRKIKDILQDQIGAITSDGIRIPDAPGATLTILTLGVNLAKIQKQRADARLVQISRRLALYERLLSEIVLADALLKDVMFVTGGTEMGKAVMEQEVVRLAYKARSERRAVDNALQAGDDARVITALQNSDRAMLALSSQLLMLRKLAVADSISVRCELGLARDSTRLDHEESLLNAQVNDQEWRTVLRSGVAVLNQYEQGGFTREDAANIIRIAQTLALGVIAGKVD
jgi:hypothetical protein